MTVRKVMPVDIGGPQAHTFDRPGPCHVTESCLPEVGLEWRAIRDEYRNFLFSQECAKIAQMVANLNRLAR